MTCRSSILLGSLAMGFLLLGCGNTTVERPLFGGGGGISGFGGDMGFGGDTSGAAGTIAIGGEVGGGTPAATGGVDFANVLKSSLDGVNQAQHQAEDLQKAFVLGDDKVSLSDTMIAMQKANISFQTAVQVRNKVVAAYNDIMNMQV